MLLAVKVYDPEEFATWLQDQQESKGSLQKIPHHSAKKIKS